MHANLLRVAILRSLTVLAVLTVLGFAASAHAAVVSYVATLSGLNESPPNASPGFGSAVVDVDAVAHTMRVRVTFGGLLGNTTASHIHAPTLVAGTGTAGVATTTPYFAGFPIGVTAGTYDNTLDMTQASSYNAAYITAQGGTVALAEVALEQAIADDKAYLNIHSTVYTGGEIRGFLVLASTPAEASTWGRVRALYR